MAPGAVIVIKAGDKADKTFIWSSPLITGEQG